MRVVVMYEASRFGNGVSERKYYVFFHFCLVQVLILPADMFLTPTLPEPMVLLP